MMIFTALDIADPPDGSDVILPRTGQTITRGWNAIWWTRGDAPHQVLRAIKRTYPPNQIIIVGTEEWAEPCSDCGVSFIHRDLWEERQSLQICPLCYQARCECRETE